MKVKTNHSLRLTLLYSAMLMLFFLNSFRGWSQGNMIAISSTVPQNMTICKDSVQFSVNIDNPSPFLLSNVEMTVTMPNGILYVPGSITNASELNITNLSAPVFSLTDISTLTNRTLSFYASAGCDVMPFLAAGNPAQNYIRVDYTGNGNNTYDDHTTDSYDVLQPNLSITAVTNQSYSGNIGDIYTRCITITNGGSGALREFTLTDEHGSGIQINNIDIGTLVNAGFTDSIFFNGADFSGIGNGDNLFNSAESITVCETVEIINCIDTESLFDAFWGCNDQSCQSSQSSANVVFPNLVPDLQIDPTASMNSCLGPGNASAQQLRVINQGLGNAVNVALDIYQSINTGYNNNLRSRLDENSFTVQINSGPVNAIVPGNTYATNSYSCMDPSPIGRVIINLDTIAAGDTVYLRWDTYSCCETSCNYGAKRINGWRYEGSYSSICQSSFLIPSAWGNGYYYIGRDLNHNYSPASLVDGDTGVFSSQFSGFRFRYPQGPGAHWEVKYILPPCLEYAGNMHFLHYNGTSTWYPDSVITAGDTATAYFGGVHPFNLDQAEVISNFKANCTSCSGGTSTLTTEIYYIPDTTCGCEIRAYCESTDINVICPVTCDGMNVKGFDIKRTSFGPPDNDEDGLPDPAPAVLDFTKVRDDRVMFGDTLTSTFNGVVKTGASPPTWDYCYATSTIDHGDRLTFIDAELTIYQASTGLTYTCTNFTPVITTTGNQRKFEYDLSAPTLITDGCVPLGFTYDDDDSLVFQPRYQVTSNPGGNILQGFVTNNFYVSDIANPTDASDKYSCNDFQGSFSIIGYYFTNYGPNDYFTSSCDQLTVSQNYYLSIGPCCSNYGGGNMFRAEYRNWAHIDTLAIELPVGYEFISARFRQIRTAGTKSTSNSGWFAITPVDPNADTLIFPVEPYFEGYGGTIPLSDDGFHGTLEVITAPSCAVAPNVAQNVRHIWYFAESDYLAGSNTNNIVSTTQDKITYNKPDLQLQSPLPTVNVPDDTIAWEINISNTTNVDAMNSWLAGPTISGITITRIYDVDNNIVINPVNGIYQLDTIFASSTRNFLITAEYTSCVTDSVIVYAGWNCNAGYPDSLEAYPCIPEQLRLQAIPQSPKPVTNVSGPDSTVLLCDTTEFMVEGLNIQIGTTYDVMLDAILPNGVVIIPGSSEMSYPDSNTYFGISDPVNISGTIWQWSLWAEDSLLGEDGLKGILDSNLSTVNVRFKVITSCGYTSGSFIGANLHGTSGCGMSTDPQIGLSPPLEITDATTPYETTVALNTTYLSPCSDDTVMYVNITNDGPLDFGISDSVIITLPPGVSYITGSFQGIYNPPLNSAPYIDTLNSQIRLTWTLPSGTAANDSVTFSFNYQGDAALLSCGITNIDAQTIAAKELICELNGTPCGVNVITGDTSRSVFTYKSYLALANANASAIPQPPNGELVDILLDIINTGENINAGNNTIISFYHDADNDSTYSAGDVFISNDTVVSQINEGSTYNYAGQINVPAGNSCSIIAVLDTSINDCSCTADEIFISVPLYTEAGTDTALCSGDSVILGHSPITGYTYSWTPTINLSNSAVSNPYLNASNTTAISDTTDYIITTNRGSCFSTDTVQIITYPELNVTLSGLAPNYCSADPADTLIAAPVGGLFTGPGLADSIFSPAIADTGNHSIEYFYTDSYGCADSASQSTIVHPSPIADFAFDSIICDGYTANFADSSSISGGFITNWDWDVNDDGTVEYTSQNSSHLFSSDGSYPVSLLITSDSGCTDDTVIQVVIAPVPIPSFTSVDTCKDNPVPFTNTSTINSGSITGYYWDFGDGASSSSPGPVHTYTMEGTYNVQLVATSDQGCTDSITQAVIIDDVPLAAFTATSVCFGNVTSFTDQSSVNGANIAGWTWIFGDGQFSNQQNPTHTYNNPGTYNVQLIVYADGVSACADDTIIEAVVYPNPLADFNTTAVCLNETTSFTDQTLSADSLVSWNWDFDNDGVADNTDDNPSYTFASAGTFPVNLLVTTDAGCSHDSTIDVTIHPLPQGAFLYDSVCANIPLNLTDQSSGGGTINQWNWDINNDGNTDYVVQNPTISWTTEGNYDVELVVITTDGCADSVINSVVVHPEPVADFSATAVCFSDSTVFTNNSSVSTGNITSWNWDYGDGTSTSSVLNPVHQYGIAGNHSVTLIVTTDQLCSDTSQQQVYVEPVPDADFSFTDACEYDTVSFINTSDGKGVSGLTYLWDFGDLLISTQFEPGHLYATEGPYNVQLTVNTPLGCSDDTSMQIIIYDQPQAQFSGASSCEYDTLLFTDNSTTTSSFNSWNWSFGDGNTSAQQDVKHKYQGEGEYQVQLVVYTVDGCSDTIVKPFEVYPQPQADFDRTEECLNSATVFTDQSTVSNSEFSDAQILTNEQWDFGDNSTVGGSGTGTGPSTTYTYNETGIYNATLVVTTNQGCRDTVTQEIRVHPNPVADFQGLYTRSCTPVNAQFQNFSTIQQQPENYTLQYLWSFGDGRTGSEENPSVSYDNESAIGVSIYDINLTVTSNKGCSDTETKNGLINVYPRPSADFDLEPSQTTIIDPNINFHNKSIGSNHWYWDFGDFVQDSIRNPVHVYQDTGTFLILLTTENSQGCVDTLSKWLKIDPEFTLYIPNAFTPNGDGLNDLFTIKGMGVKDLDLYIFNRWGEVIYQDRDIESAAWDGTFNGKPADQGVYGYRVVVTDVFNQSHDYLGSVTLIR